MITDNMTLTTIRDATLWATELGGSYITDAQVERLADWIWENKPGHQCAFGDHPISTMQDDKFWAIAGDENHDDYTAAVAAGATVIEFGGKKYAVTREAEYSNRVFPGSFNDADDDGNHIAEYRAPAIGTDGCDYWVVWQFDENKNDELSTDEYGHDWDNITDVNLA